MTIVGGNRSLQTARGRTQSAIRWACERLGFSACYPLSLWELLLYGGGFLLVALFVGLLVIGFVIGRFTR